MQITLNTEYDAFENECVLTNEQMVQASGARFVLPLTGTVDRIIDSPTKEGQKAARLVVDPRWGFEPGFAITLDLEALVPEPACEGAPCDCPTGTHDTIDAEAAEEEE